MILVHSKRFERVYKETREIWHYQQYLFTEEYYTRAPFIPPVSLIINVYRLIRKLVFNIRRRYLKKSSDPNVRVFRK